MSRIGKRPVSLPSGVTAEVNGQTVNVKGPKGARSFTATDDVTLAVEDGAGHASPRAAAPSGRASSGACRGRWWRTSSPG